MHVCRWGILRKFGDLHLLKMTVVPGNMLMLLGFFAAPSVAASGDRRLSHNARLDLLNKFQAGSLAAVVRLSHFVSEEEKCHLGLVTSNPEVCRHAQ